MIGEKMNVKRARKHMAAALKSDPQYRWDWQEVMARYLIEDARKAEKADLKSYPSAFILAGALIDEIFK
jgi:Tfp pilus assembly protein PilF